MWKAVFRSILERKLRLILTGLAIVLGVGFVSGTFILTDAIDRGFKEIFEKAIAGYDVLVRAKTVFDEGPAEREKVSQEVLEKVRQVDGVRAAEGSIDDLLVLLDKQGKPIERQGPPVLATSYGRADLSVLEIRQGRFPRSVQEAAMDAASAERLGLRVGDQFQAVAKGPVRKFELTGVAQVRGLQDLGGATLVIFDLGSAQILFQTGSSFSSVVAAAEADVSQEELRRRIQSSLPSGYEAITQDAVVSEISEDISQGTQIVTRALLTFAGVSLFVGAFLIFNTFSILLAQRTREFALLRAIGALRGQLMRAVVVEAALVGAVASLLGMGFGFAIAVGLKRLISTGGGEIPSAPLRLGLGPGALSLLVGIMVTLVAAMMPAIRATRVPPVAALKEGAVLPPSRFGKARHGISGFLVLSGAALIGWGLFGEPSERALVIGAGTISVFLAISLLSPLIVGPFSNFVGWPIARFFGIPGKIGRGNARRDPNRTAATAAALMIGVALVTFVTVFASSIQTSLADRLARNLRADFVISPRGEGEINNEVAERLEASPELRSEVMQLNRGLVRAAGETLIVGGIEQNRVSKFRAIVMKQGRLSDLDDGIFIHEELAADSGWKQGDTVTLQFARTRERLRINGIFEDEVLGSDLLISRARWSERFVNEDAFRIYVSASQGTSLAATRAALEKELRDFPDVSLLDQAEIRRQNKESLDTGLRLISGLLGLALLIAFFGIVNTLALSILERVREIGLLRAIGASRRHIRAIVRWEAVIVAVMGTTLGLLLGVAFAKVMMMSLKEEGLESFVVPADRLTAFMLIAALAGVLAAVFPARRAARMDVLKAISYE